MPRKKQPPPIPVETPKLYVRWMIRRDIPEVLEIERRCFDCPKVELDFLTWLRQRNIIGMVTEFGDSSNPPIAGFMIYELHTKHLTLLDFAVHPNYQRRGVGAKMIDRLLQKLSSHRRTKIVIDVPERRLGAQVFFRAMKFEAVRVLREAYDGEDAYRMVLRFGDEPEQSDEPVNRIVGLEDDW